MTTIVAAAKTKISELSKLLPLDLQEFAYFTPDGCFVWLDFTVEISEAHKQIVKQIADANQACYARDSVSGRVKLQFPVDHPTCGMDGKPLIDLDEIEKQLDHSQPPTVIINQREKLIQEKRDTLPQSPSSSLPAALSISELYPKHITPMGDYSSLFCSTCINPNADRLPCSEHEVCVASNQALLLQAIKKQQENITNILKTTVDILATVKEILQQHQQQRLQAENSGKSEHVTPAPSVVNTPTPTTQKTPMTPTPVVTHSTVSTTTQNPPTTSTQPQQQPPQQSLENKPVHNVTKEDYAKRQAKETKYFIKDGITWMKSETSTGKPVDKAYMDKNMGKDGKPTAAYLNLPSTAGVHNDTFWMVNDPRNPRPYKAKMAGAT